MIVVDASWLTNALLRRPPASAALDADLTTAPGRFVHAPELIELEVLSALRGLLRRGLVTTARAGLALEHLADLRLVRYPHAPLRARVWRLRDRLSAYDAAYVALAEALDAETLVTGDRPMAAAAAGILGAHRVELVT